MAFTRLRRLIFVVAAMALMLVAVLPLRIVSANMADMDPAVSSEMQCPDCFNKMTKGGTAPCAQVFCISVAISGDRGFTFGLKRETFFETAALGPDEVDFAPATPPI